MAGFTEIDPSRLLHADLGRLLGDEQLTQAYHERRQQVLDVELGQRSSSGAGAAGGSPQSRNLQHSDRVAATSKSLRRLPSLQADAFEHINLGTDDMLLQAFRFARGAPDTRVLYVPDDEISAAGPAVGGKEAAESVSAASADATMATGDPLTDVKAMTVPAGSSPQLVSSLSKRRARKPLALNLQGASNKEPAPHPPSGADTPVLDSARRDAILARAHRPVALPDASVPEHLAPSAKAASPPPQAAPQPQQQPDTASRNVRRRRKLISGHLQSPEVQGVMRGIDSVLGALQNDSSDDEVDRVRWGRQAPPSQAKGWSKFSKLVHTGAWREEGQDAPPPQTGASGSGGGSSVLGLRKLVLAAQHNVKSAASRDPREWQLDAIRVTGQKRRRRNRAMARRLSSEQQFLSAQKTQLAPILSPAAERGSAHGAPPVRTHGPVADLAFSASAPSLGSLRPVPGSSLGLSASGVSAEQGTDTWKRTAAPAALASAFNSARSADIEAALIEADVLLDDSKPAEWGAGGPSKSQAISAQKATAAAAARRTRAAVQLRAYGGNNVHPAIISAESAAAMLAHPATKPVKGGLAASSPPAHTRSEANNPKSPYRLGVLSSTVNPRWRAWAYHYNRTQGKAQAELQQSPEEAHSTAMGSATKPSPWALSTLPASPMGREVAGLGGTLGSSSRREGGEGGVNVRGPGGLLVHQVRMLHTSAMSSSSKPLSPGTGGGTSLSLGGASSSSSAGQSGTAQRDGMHRQLAKASTPWGAEGQYNESSSSEDEGAASSNLTALEMALSDLELQVAVDESRTRAVVARGGHHVPVRGVHKPEANHKRRPRQKHLQAPAATRNNAGPRAPTGGKRAPEQAWVFPSARGLDAPASLSALGHWSRHPSQKWAHLPFQDAVSTHASWAMRAARAEAETATGSAVASLVTRPGPSMGEEGPFEGSTAAHHAAVLRTHGGSSRRSVRQHLQGGDVWLLDRAMLAPATTDQASPAASEHRIEGSTQACVPVHPLPAPAGGTTAPPVSGDAASEAAVRRLTAHLVHRAPPLRSAAPPKPGSRQHSSAIGRAGLLEAASDPQADQRATVAARAADDAAHGDAPRHTHTSMREREAQQQRSHHVSAAVALISHPSINPSRQVNALRSWTLTQLAAVAADAENFGRTIPVDAADSVVSAVFEDERVRSEGGVDEVQGGSTSAQLLRKAHESLQGGGSSTNDAVGIAEDGVGALPPVYCIEDWLREGSLWSQRQAKRLATSSDPSEQASVLSQAKARFFAQWQQLSRSPLSAVLEAGVSLRPRASMRAALGDALATDHQRLNLRGEVTQAALQHSLGGAAGHVSLGSGVRPLSAAHFLRRGVLADDHPESTLAFLQQSVTGERETDDEVGGWSSNELLDGMWAARGAIHAAGGVMEVCRSATAQLATQLAERCAEEGETLRLVWHDVRELWEVDAVLAEADAACAQQDSSNVLASLGDLTQAVQRETAQSDVLLAVVESQYSTLAGLMQRTDDAGVPLGGLSTAQLRSAAAILTRNAAAAGLRKDEVLSSSTIRSVLDSVRKSVGGGDGKRVPPSQSMQQPPSNEQRARKGGLLSGAKLVTHSVKPGPPSRSAPLPPGTPKPGFDPSKVHLQQRGWQADTALGEQSSLANAAGSSSFAFSDDDEDSEEDSS